MSHTPPPHSNPTSQYHFSERASSKSNFNTALLSSFAILYLILLYLNPRRPLDLLTHILARLRGMLRLNKTTDLLAKVPQAMGTAVASAAGGSEGGVTAGVVEKVRKASTGVLARMSGRGGNGDVDVPPGLGNWDNSCYQNSVLQGLAGLEAVRPFLRGLPSSAGGEGSEESTAGSLLETLQRLNDPANNGRQLWTPAKLKKMSSWQQQDAQEYFSKILEEVEKEATKAYSSSALSASRTSGLESLVPTNKSTTPESAPATGLTLPKNPLDGLLAQKVTCTRCLHSTGLSLIPFNCLTLPLPLQNEPTELSDCLDEYTKREEIPQVECAKCTLLHAQKSLAARLPADPGYQSTDLDAAAPLREKVMQLPPELRAQSFQRLATLQQALSAEDFADKTLTETCGISRQERVSSTKTREAMVARAPACLVLHANRSVFDEMTGVQRKNYVRVGYPLRLGLEKWMGGLEDSNDESGMEEGSGVGYVLKAVVTHYGRHENGHYICYRRHPRVLKQEDAEEVAMEVEDEDAVAQQRDPEVKEKKPDPWYRLSDEDVTPVAEEDVLSQGGVFMLFYELEHPSDDRPTSISDPESVEEDLPVKEPLTTAEAAEVLLTPEMGFDKVDSTVTPQDLAVAPTTQPSPSPKLDASPAPPAPFSTTASTPPASGTSSPLAPTTPTMSTTTYDSEPDLYSQSTKTQDSSRKSESSVSTSPVRMRTARGMEDAAVEEGMEGNWMFRGATRVAAT